MSDSILDGKMHCSVTGKLVYSDEVYMDEADEELKCPCHNKPITVKGEIVI